MDNQYFPFQSLVGYYMDICGIDKAPEFYSSNNGFNVLMPANQAVEDQFAAYIKMLGYKLTSRYLWENVGITNNPRMIHKKRIQVIGGGFHANFEADHVLQVSYEFNFLGHEVERRNYANSQN